MNLLGRIEVGKDSLTICRDDVCSRKYMSVGKNAIARFFIISQNHPNSPSKKSYMSLFYSWIYPSKAYQYLPFNLFGIKCSRFAKQAAKEVTGSHVWQ
jgi:hypothetical protein